MTVLLLGSLAEEERALWLCHLAAALPGETLSDQPGEVDPSEVDIALVANPPPGSLQGWPALRLVQSLWAGVDRLLEDPSLPAGVPIARMVDPAMSRAMAETALWATLAVHRGFFGYLGQQRASQWRQWPQRRADEVQVAVLGLGQMGGTVARRLAGQGYRVRGWRAGGGSRSTALGQLGSLGQLTADSAVHRPTSAPEIVELDGPDSLPQCLEGCDLVINLLPLTPATRGLLDARFFETMAAGATLANFARGDHVVEAELLAALETGHLAHAVLDVFSAEPLSPSHVFWQHPRVTVLPHVAAQTDPRSAAAVVAANVAALRTGRPLAHLVEPLRGY